MDNTKIAMILFMNLVIIFILSLIISTCVREYRKKRISHEGKKLLIFKEIISDSDVILLLICAVLFYYFTCPLIQDIPYLTGQKFEEASGTITQCNANGIVAEVMYKNNSTANIEIKGSYDLNRGEEIVVRYLPHTDVRMEWYILDDVTGEPVYLETGSSSLIDNRAFMLVMALGCPMAVKFITLIFLKKLEEEEKKDRMRHLKMLKYAENIAMVIGALFMLRFISLNL